MTWRAEPLIPGVAEGRALRLDAPISFWGGVDPTTSEIVLAGHPQRGVAIAGTILVVDRLLGSSSSSAVMLELLHAGRAPRGLILGCRDAILPIGVLVAGQMGWPTIPVLLLPDPPFRTGDALTIAEDGRITRSP
ncbi:MAG: DUF126 domain-containing protein [Pseudomonadota bacterium]